MQAVMYTGRACSRRTPPESGCISAPNRCGGRTLVRSKSEQQTVLSRSTVTRHGHRERVFYFMDAIEVGVLGATGVVGQQFVSRLARHPWFRCTWLAASERSEGKTYKSVAPWRLSTPIPGTSAERIVEGCVPGRGPKVVFSGLDASVAGEIECAFATAGHIVVPHARNFRMDPVVPLLLPEVNPDHLALLAEQRQQKQWRGAIVTNPNCSTIVLAMALAPLRQFNIRGVVVSTMQAVSGAGYPGVPSLDILGNVVPFIVGEEEKKQTELLKNLGKNGGHSTCTAAANDATTQES